MKVFNIPVYGMALKFIERPNEYLNMKHNLVNDQMSNCIWGRAPGFNLMEYVKRN